jgi:flagellar hook-associated protein 3 FlgL
MIDNRLEDLNSFITEYLSKETDADITEVVAQLSMDQAVLQAALKSSAKVITPTLVDFLS